VAHITVDGLDVSESLVRHGHAWQFRRYSSDPHLAKLQDEARAEHAGLWSQPNPIAPWEYRHPEQLVNVVEVPASPNSSPVQVAAGRFSCGAKRDCKQMSSCEEAQFFLHQCGVSRLDRDGNGVACETLC